MPSIKNITPAIIPTTLFVSSGTSKSTTPAATVSIDVKIE